MSHIGQNCDRLTQFPSASEENKHWLKTIFAMPRIMKQWRDRIAPIFYFQNFFKEVNMESVKVKRFSDRIVIEITSDDGQTKEEYFRGVRCGLSYPSATSQGYFVLVGQYDKRNTTGKFPLRLLKEGQGETPGKLFQKLFDETGAFHCWEIFLDLSEKNFSYIYAFEQERGANRNLQDITLELAPYFQNFPHGVSLIKEWIADEALHIPRDTIVHSQLTAITAENMQADPERTFFAVNALRLVMGAFETSLSFPSPSSNRGPFPKPIPPEAWT
jgi:hypothetical protein